LRAFFYFNRCIDSSSQLFIVGPSWVDRYDEQLRWLADCFGLMGRVHFTGRVSDADLAMYYRTCDLFLSMSEHEGFAVPLVESMAFGLPILAYDSTAIPYTLDGAGLTFKDKDPAGVGELMEVIRSDDKVRNALLESERERLEHFSPETVRAALREALGRALGEAR
jgi:glycosyltransferase involved in cell wall biosynthesis